MTDRHEQHDQPDPPGFEIPLTGDGPLANPIDEQAVPPPNWRKIVGFASLGGVVGGIVLSAVLLGVVWNDDDGNDDGNDDGVDPFTTIVTTPPTLASLGTIPEPEQGLSTGSAGPGAPAREGSLLDLINVPTYPPVTGREVTSADGFDLYRAVSQLEIDAARRSSTRLELGVGGYLRDFTILRDPTSDRYLVDREGAVSIFDGTTGLAYVDFSLPGDEQWLPSDDRPLAESVGVDSVPALYQRLMLGPIRPDTIGSATVTPGEFVILDDGLTVARAFARRAARSTDPRVAALRLRADQRVRSLRPPHPNDLHGVRRRAQPDPADRRSQRSGTHPATRRARPRHARRTVPDRAARPRHHQHGPATFPGRAVNTRSRVDRT